jgi:uncharacterized iron-regulated membrane protein
MYNRSEKRRTPEMTLRSVHRVIGLATAPLMIITAVAGLILLYRKTGIYERGGEFRSAMQRLHNYELFAPYVGTVASVLMVAVAVTGVALYWQIRARRRNAMASKK